MADEIRNHILNLISQVVKKNDLHQMIFDLNRLKDKISYKTVAGNHQDRGILKELATSETNKLGSETLKNYLRGMLAKDDLRLFEPANLRAFAEEFELEALKTDFLELTCAVKLEADDIKNIAQKMSEKVGRKVVVDAIHNPSLIAGVIIKKDNYILDFSVQTKLLNLSQRWKQSLSKNL